MQLSGYGVMIALGLLASGAVGWYLTRREGLNFYDFLLLAVFTVTFGVVGAKLAYLALNFRYIAWGRLADPAYLSALWSGGFIFYGGVPLGLLGFWLAQKLYKLDGRSYLRLGLPLLPLTHAFGRVGCFLAGCCFGTPYSGPLAVTYPPNDLGTPAGVPLFPVQLAEAAAEFAIFALLLWLALRGAGVERLLGSYLLTYGVVRFGLEYLRYDAARGVWGPFSTSQWVSVAGVVIGMVCIARSRRHEQ